MWIALNLMVRTDPVNFNGLNNRSVVFQTHSTVFTRSFYPYMHHLSSLFPLSAIMGYFFQQFSGQVKKTLPIYLNWAEAYSNLYIHWTNVRFNAMQRYCAGVSCINVPWIVFPQWWFLETLYSSEKEFQECFCLDPDPEKIFFRTGALLKLFLFAKT